MTQRREATPSLVLAGQELVPRRLATGVDDMAAISATQLSQFEEEGYLVVRGLLDPEEDLDPVIREYEGVLDTLAVELRAQGRISSTRRTLPRLEKMKSTTIITIPPTTRAAIITPRLSRFFPITFRFLFLERPPWPFSLTISKLNCYMRPTRSLGIGEKELRRDKMKRLMAAVLKGDTILYMIAGRSSARRLGPR